MKPDAELREDVILELTWDPQVTDPDAIAVAVKDGAVTLAGRVPAYAENLAAVRAAGRVAGVRAVADQLRVQLSGKPLDDSDIARAIAHALAGTPRSRRGRYEPRFRPAGSPWRARSIPATSAGRRSRRSGTSAV